MPILNVSLRHLCKGGVGFFLRTSRAITGGVVLSTLIREISGSSKHQIHVDNGNLLWNTVSNFNDPVTARMEYTKLLLELYCWKSCVISIWSRKSQRQCNVLGLRDWRSHLTCVDLDQGNVHHKRTDILAYDMPDTKSFLTLVRFPYSLQILNLHRWPYWWSSFFRSGNKWVRTRKGRFKWTKMAG